MPPMSFSICFSQCGKKVTVSVCSAEDGVLNLAARLQRLARVVELANGLLRDRQEGSSLPGKFGRKRRPVDQCNAQPEFKLLDAAGKRGLRHMTGICRARETRRCRQRDEVFQPFQFHRAGLLKGEVMRMIIISAYFLLH